MPKLDKRTVASLSGPEAGRFDVIHWDDDLPGFGLRVLASGARSWCVRYRIGNKSRLIALGKLAALKPAEARSEAQRILAGAKLGHDEREEINARKAKGSSAAAESFAQVVELYLRHVVSGKRPRTQVERKRHLNVHWKPLHGKPIGDISRREIASRLLELKDQHGPIAANRARGSLNAFFVWAMQQGIAEANPVMGTAPPGEERERERVLSANELRSVWQPTEGQGDYSAIVRLLILTGQRREEVAAMRWPELDLDRALWTIPSERTKNKRSHEVPLPDQAIAMLKTRPRREKRELIFGEGKGPFSGWSRAKKALDRRILERRRKELTEAGGDAAQAKPLEAWTLHDLRRTAVTQMNELGIAPHVVEAVINHVSGTKAGVAGTYNRAIYAAEKRAALQTYADWLEAVVEGRKPGGNVVALRA
jgi:integrase